MQRIRMDGRQLLFLLGVAHLVNAADNSYFNGYTTASCMSLEPPGHSGTPAQSGVGGYSVSIIATEYSPDVVYTVTLVATLQRFSGFMVQGRRKDTQTTAGSFIGSSSVLSSKRSQALTCSSSNDSVTNSNPNGLPYPLQLSFAWSAPSLSVGDICFKSSVVEISSLWYIPKDYCISPVQMEPTPSPTSSAVVTSQSGNVSVATSIVTPQGTTVVATTETATSQGPTTVLSTTEQPTTVALTQPRVRVNPSKLEASRGSDAMFHCDLLGSPLPTLAQWKRGGTNSDLGKANPLVINNIQFSDQGMYICEADSGGSTLSNSGMLVISEKPLVTIQPTSVTVVLGNYTADIQLQCDAVGGIPVSLVWVKDGKKLTGETRKQLTVPPVRSSDGEYRCNFSNPYGNVLSEVAVIAVQVTPNFTVQPQDIWITAGTRAQFSCQAEGNPNPTIQWFKDGSALIHRTENTLVIADVEKGHDGQYWCTATNDVSVETSRKATLIVITKVPTFVKHPLSQAVDYGATLTLTCPTLAHPPPSIQWLKDGIPLLGAMGDTLKIESFTDANEGNYSCNATNALGYNVSIPAVVVVYRESPSFLQQPEGGIIYIGDPFNFTCIAKGVPDPTYSWYKTGKRIPGATSSILPIKSAMLSDSTYYFCSAMNVEGRKNSSPVYLIINPRPTTVAPTITKDIVNGSTTATAVFNVSTTVEANATAKQVGTTSASRRSPSLGATVATTKMATVPLATNATINATTAVPGNEGDAATSVNVPAIVAPVVVVLGAIIIILVVLLLVQRHRHASPRRKSDLMDRLALTGNIDTDAISEMESTQGDKVHVDLVREGIKSSADLEQLLGRTPTYIHRINKSSSLDSAGLQRLLERVASHPDDADEPHEVKKQFEETPSNMVTIQKTPAGTESKNRYMNVLPNPHSAVRLLPINDDPTTTYINANYVRGYPKKPKAYIATQGPIPSTRNDFWRMIWEQKVTMVIMSTGLVERGRMKCCRYWPDTSQEKEMTYGNYTVGVLDETPGPHYSITTLTVKDNTQHEEQDENEDGSEPEIRTLKHYWFTGWPDFGIPRNTGPVLDFLTLIQRDVTPQSGPVLVHCSAGIGRTGTFIGIEMGMQQYVKEGIVDPLQYMCNMRQDRGGSIQTADQYLFIHQALADFISRMDK